MKVLIYHRQKACEGPYHCEFLVKCNNSTEILTNAKNVYTVTSYAQERNRKSPPGWLFSVMVGGMKLSLKMTLKPSNPTTLHARCRALKCLQGRAQTSVSSKNGVSLLFEPIRICDKDIGTLDGVRLMSLMGAAQKRPESRFARLLCTEPKIIVFEIEDKARLWYHQRR
jgi:hypothetical protein